MNQPISAPAPAEFIIHSSKITTLDPLCPEAEAIAVANGKIIAVGSNDEIMPLAVAGTQIIDGKRRRIVPGLNDSHLHLIRGGLNYNLELRWDGVPTLAEALTMLKRQAARTPPPQWVRVVGGWGEFQFAERRMPTLEEINTAAPETPVFVLHLYDRAWLNGAALRAVGYNKNTPNPPGGVIEHDRHGNPTGLILAQPNANILYSTLARGPKLPPEYQRNSTLHFMRELNRLGITSAIDAGGGFQNYPEDYAIINDIAEKDELTVRISYNLFTQHNGGELDDFAGWIKDNKIDQGNDHYRLNGAGEMLVFSAADFEDFLQPRPDLPTDMEEKLKAVVRLLVENRWPFRLHATYDESIGRFLTVFEAVNQEIPFDGLTWFFDHAETISERNLERVKALGGGIAIQNRMAFQGEYFVDRYGAEAAAHTPPIRKMLETGIPVGAGTDATRVSSYNPWVSIYWLTTGNTVGGMNLYSADNCVDRLTALRLYTEGSAWFSRESGRKGAIKPGQFADFTALSEDYFTIGDEAIKSLESVLTVVGGKVVYGSAEFSGLSPSLPPPMPDWAPTGLFGGYHKASQPPQMAQPHACIGACAVHYHQHDLARKSNMPVQDYTGFWGVLGCSCFSF